MNPSLATRTEPLPGYRLIERLGRGGYGEVWKAEAPGGLFKAIKFVYGDLNGVGDDNKAAEQELKALNRVKTIRHPYILSIERFDVVDGQLLIVMELADRNLWDRFQECRNQGLTGIPQDELLRYMDEICEALDLMNGHYQIQHLDIKPQNLFLIHNHIKVADFGLAKDFEGVRATVTGGVTPVYAPPETFEGWISRFSDQYSLAIVYQELLTGVRPFAGTNTRHLLMQHLSAPPDVSPLPPIQREVIARGLSKKPDQRFPSCAEFGKALRQAVEREAGSASGTRTPGASADSTQSRKPQEVEPTQPQPVHTPATLPQPVISPGSPSKGLPKLVTPGADGQTARGPANKAPVTLLRPIELTPGTVPPPEAEGPGILFPVYIVGLGMTGLRFMRRLRSQLLERTGQPTLPHWKWLFIDTDAKAIQTATEPGSHKSFERDEVYHARLQRPAHYLKSSSLAGLDQWLGGEMLYRIPREPATEGIRSLGRLALLDHFEPITQKIGRDLGTFANDAALQEGERIVKLGIRSKQPRVYIAASLCGGSGAGMLIDCAYLIKNEARKLGFENAKLTGTLFVPIVDKSTPKSLGVANACATLAEIDHYSRPGARYHARFDSRFPPITDPDPPFQRGLLLTLPRSSSGSSSTLPNADRAAGLVAQETLTTLGARVEQTRSKPRPGPYDRRMTLQSFGYCRLVWPRRRLLEVAARRLAGRVIQRWSDKDLSFPADRLEAELHEFWQKSQLDEPSLRSMIERAIADALNGRPVDTIEQTLASFRAEPGGVSRRGGAEFASAVEQIFDLVGSLGDDDRQLGHVAAALDNAVRPIRKEAEVKLAKMAVQFVERPEFRLAGAEAAVRRGAERLQKATDEIEKQLGHWNHYLAEEMLRLRTQIATVSTSTGPGDRRKATLLAETAEWLQAWATKRWECHVNRALVNIYRRMMGNIPEYMRELTESRRKLSETAAGLLKEAERDANSFPLQDMPILPAEARNLLEASDRLISEIPAERHREFEADTQFAIRKQFDGLVNACLTNQSASPRFKEMLVSTSRQVLESHLGSLTVSSAFFRNQPDTQAAHRAILRAYEESEPELFGSAVRPESQRVFLAAADDEGGKRFKDTARELIPDQTILDAPATDEIVFYRECLDISFPDLPQTGALAVDAVRSIVKTDSIRVYSRGDIGWNSFLKE
jgi:serine/threonine protein kinase